MKTIFTILGIIMLIPFMIITTFGIIKAIKEVIQLIKIGNAELKNQKDKNKREV